MKLSLKYKIFFFLFFAFSKLIAQENIFSHYSVNEGLSQSVVNCIFQDSEGFIWVGTQDGLNKFNGYTFEKFTHNPTDTNSLANNWIYSVSEDFSGNIWIGTRSGLHKLDKKINKIVRYQHTADYSTLNYTDVVYGVAVSKEGYIITNTPPYINFFDPKTGKFTHFLNTIGSNTSIEDQCLPVLTDKDGLIWVATAEGIACYDYKTLAFTNYTYNNTNKKLSNNFITALFIDKKNNLWIGTKKGLNKLNKSTKEITSYFSNPQKRNSLSNNYIYSIIEDRYNNLWVGTNGGGLNKITFKNDTLNFTFFNKTEDASNIGLSHDVVPSLMLDKSDNLWIGTLSGLDKLNIKKKKFKIYRKSELPNSINLLDNVVASVFKDDKGLIWIGNWGKGLNILDRKTSIVKHYTSTSNPKNRISNDFVHVIFKDSKRNIWIGTRDGIDMYNPATESFVPIQTYFKTKKIPDFKDNRIYCMLEDQNHFIWIGTRDGLYKLNMNNFSFEVFKSGTNPKTSISDNLIYAIIQDFNHNIWIATSQGLDKYDYKLNIFTHFKRNEKIINTLCDNFIVALCQDYKGNIWIGTKSGMNIYNPKDSVFKYFSEKDGLPSNVIYEIQEDKNKNIWLGTGRGLAVYKNEENIFKTYDVSDGLQSLEFNLRASFKSPDGEMFFGGMNGLNSFYPDSIKNNTYIPNIVFTRFEKTNGYSKVVLPIDSTGIINLNYNDYSFSIEFAALEYTDQTKNNYAYKIDESSDNWIEIGTRHFVPFTNLPPGKYVFQVIGTNNDGVWNKDGATITIIIHPPWYKTTLAILSYFIIVFLVVFSIIRFRFRILKRQNEILEHKVKIRTEEVENQKNEILLKNEVLEAQTNEIKAQRDEIEAQMNMVTLQRDQIFQQKNQITDSINYAKRIQTAVLPPDEIFEQLLSGYFIYFKPRDIVSGDFYWIKKIHKKMIIAMADCTGHGVPGAFMSMLGCSALNEIVSNLMETKNILDVRAGYILDELRIRIKTDLRQTGKKDEQKEGMDMTLCIVDLETNILDFAGANNPAWIIRNMDNDDERNFIDIEHITVIRSDINHNILYELKPDKMPLGIYMGDEHPFRSLSFKLKPNDIIYLFSDGYKDQFGNEKREKFKSHRFKELLLRISNKNMKTQQEILDETLENWVGGRYKQIDDITVMGLKF